MQRAQSNASEYWIQGAVSACCTRGGSRTHTTRRPRDFESRASANSATLACGRNLFYLESIGISIFPLSEACLCKTPVWHHILTNRCRKSHQSLPRAVLLHGICFVE